MDHVRLMKPRVMSLVIFTALVGLVAAPGHMNPLTAAASILALALGSGAAGALNMWYDADIDAVMARTASRPVPAGLISRSDALGFGLIMSALSVTLMALAATPLAAALLAFSIFFYAVVYTMWLKRSTAQNIVIGGAAGAIPPLVGYAAVTGGLDLAAAYLFAIIFFWTPPHFWALALIKRGDYARAGVPMLPVVRGDRVTKVQMLVYTLMLLPLTLMPSLFGAFGAVYFAAAALLGARLLWYCLRLLREEGPTGTPWRMYRYSLLYLALLFVAMGVDRALPFRSPLERPELIVLDRPDVAAAAPDDHSHHVP
jgi:protoheme IX farnesyltransferase